MKKRMAGALVLIALVLIGFSPTVQSFRSASRGRVSLGKFLRLRPTGVNVFDAVYEHGVVPVREAGDGKRPQYFYGVPSVRSTTLAGRTRALAGLPGTVSYYIPQVDGAHARID